MNTTFVVHRENTRTGFEFSTSAPSELNNTTRGDTATFTAEIEPVSDTLTVAGGESYTIPSESNEFYQTVTVESNATLTVEGKLFTEVLNDNGGSVNITVSGEIIQQDTISGYGGLLDLDEYAGKHSVEESFNGTQYFKEFTPDSVSLVIGIKPNQDLQDKDIPGVWGLVSNVTDERNTTLNTDRLTLEVTILAPFSEYATPSNVQDALETQ